MKMSKIYFPTFHKKRTGMFLRGHFLAVGQAYSSLLSDILLEMLSTFHPKYLLPSTSISYSVSIRREGNYFIEIKKKYSASSGWWDHKDS
jgi:hypothetical protein